MRKAQRPLSDAERDWVKKAKLTVDNLLPGFSALTTEFTSNMPVIFRGSFWATAQKHGAVTQAMIDKISAKRLEGINVSNEFGKQSAVLGRMTEYTKRFPILAAELAQAEKERTGKGFEGTAELTKKIKALEAGNAAWDKELDDKIAILVSSISAFFKVDKKSFGESLLKNVKSLVSAKEKAKDQAKAKADQMNAQAKMARWPADLKAVKVALDKREKDIDALAKQVDEALVAIKK